MAPSSIMFGVDGKPAKIYVLFLKIGLRKIEATTLEACALVHAAEPTMLLARRWELVEAFNILMMCVGVMAGNMTLLMATPFTSLVGVANTC
jgi:hypothetical protein